MITLQIALLKMSVLILQLTLATSTMTIDNSKVAINGTGLEKEAVMSGGTEKSLSLAVEAVEAVRSDYGAKIDQTSTTIKQYIAEIAEKHEIPVERMLWIAEKESQFETNRVGDTDKKCKDGRQMQSRGLWQINSCYWKVSDEVAFDVVSSTQWAIPHLKNNPDIWSTFKYKCKWFGNCE